MHFRGFIYDPYTSDNLEEWKDYYFFINRIRELASIEIDESNPEKEENTYLWVKMILSDSEDNLDLVKVPYFRLNKLLFEEAYAQRKNPHNPGKLYPRELLQDEILKAIYPDRLNASLYISAIAHLNFVDNEGELQLADVEQHHQMEDKEFVFGNTEIAYSQEDGFNCELSEKTLKRALVHFQGLLEFENGHELMKQTPYKQSLATVCFFIAEAVRFQLVQFAAMNMLVYKDKINPGYSFWDKWEPIIHKWSALSDHLEKAGHRRLDPALLLGIPLFIRNRVQNSSLFGNTDIVNVLESYFHNPNHTQDSVIKDFSTHYPEIYFSEDVMPTRNSGDERYLQLCTLRQLSLNQIDSMKDEAKQLFSERKYQAALDVYLRALALYEKEELFDDREISLKYNIGLIYYKLKQYEPAIQYLENALEACWSDNEEEKLRIEELLDTCKVQASNCSLQNAPPPIGKKDVPIIE